MTVWYFFKHKQANPFINISTTTPFKGLGGGYKVWIMHLTFVMRVMVVALVIVALARPQIHDNRQNSLVDGTDIVVALDISGSMLANDIKPNRLAAAKDVATKFITSRENDRIGLVVFSGESLSLMPLTTDRAALINAVNEINAGALNDGTAIGDGLASAVNRLLAGLAKSKSVILITDGTNNAGDVAPSTAAEIARQNGIRVYTIGVGKDSSISIPDPYGFQTVNVEAKIDEESLKSIANNTNGKFFRASDKRALENVFQEIDKLEKSKLEVQNFTKTDENFMPWLCAALGILVLQLICRYLILKRIP